MSTPQISADGTIRKRPPAPFSGRGGRVYIINLFKVSSVYEILYIYYNKLIRLFFRYPLAPLFRLCLIHGPRKTIFLEKKIYHQAGNARTHKAPARAPHHANGPRSAGPQAVRLTLISYNIYFTRFFYPKFRRSRTEPRNVYADHGLRQILLILYA